MHEYYQLLAKSSNRVKLVELGKSSEGRPFIALFISSPANLAKLDQYRQINAKLADPRGLPEADVRKLVADGKAVTIQSFALHSSEVAASQTAAEFVFDSLSRTDEEALRNLDNVISIVLPSINPDGTQMIADWYMLMDKEIKAGGLEARYDTIILPADSIAAMTGERPTAGAAGGGGGGFGGGPDNAPDEYKSGFGADGVKALQDFVQKGGTLMTFANAGDLPIQRFGLPLRNVVAGLPSKQFWSPGSTLRVSFNNASPLAYGMPDEGLALFMAGGQVYEVTSTDRSQDVEILATYADRDLLQSGWLLGEQVIAKKAAAVSVKLGQGKVVLVGFRPQHRDQTHGTYKFVFNALLNGLASAATPNTAQP